MNYIIWTTYHNDSLISKHQLKEDNHHKLFGTHNDVDGINLNFFGKILNEATTMYYVWKNNIYSDFVGFDHYNRRLNIKSKLKKYECHVYNIDKHWMIKGQSDSAIKPEDYNLILDILDNFYGKGNKYYKYMNNEHPQLFIFNEIYLISWKKFLQLCEFIFQVFFEFDKRIKGNLNYDHYLKRYNGNMYFARCFYIERLISCWLVNNFEENKIIVSR